MHEASLDEVYRAINDSLAQERYNHVEALVWPALDQFPNDPQLLFYASHLFTKQNKLVPALLCAMKSQELEPSGANYTNMGALFRRMNMPEEAYACLEEAVGYDPKNKHTWNNLAAAYVNEGNPDPGIAAAKEALRLDGQFAKARWNKGLLELEKGNFRTGFREYRSGLVAGERLEKTYAADKKDEPKMLKRLSELRKWTREHNNTRPRIVVWGEQGLGDELMFATCLPDLDKWANIVFDCHPRMIEIFRRSYPFLRGLFPTRKDQDVSWYNDIEPCQFKCSIGELPRFFRLTRDAFTEATAEYSPWYKADMEEVTLYRETLQEVAPGKILLGIGWTGGIISTQRWYRCCQLEELKPLINHPSIQPVSLQYEDDAKHVTQYLEDAGVLVLRCPGITTHYDYHHHHSLLGAMDSIVTVCSTTAHLAAASGYRTHVLVPDKPAWRYGLTGSDWFWYGDNATLYRKENGSWESAIERVTKAVFEEYGLEDWR